MIREWWRGETSWNTIVGWLSLGAGVLSLASIFVYGLLSDFSLSVMVGVWAFAYYFVFHYLVLRKAKLKPWAFAGLAVMAVGYWLFITAALLALVLR